MKTIIEKHWISFLGIGFVFLAFIYFLKMAIDLGWLPPEARAASGLVLGISALFAGYTFYNKKMGLTAESIGGLGTGIIYATIAYASFSEHIQWSSNILGITTIALSSVICYTSYKLNMRVLVLIGILGGLLTPLIIKASPEQDFILFLYIFIINVSALYVSAMKNWRELRVVTFVSTLAIYISYYFFFDPEHWSKPFIYISALYFVYLFGLILSSWKEENKFDGVNLYIGMLNAINYVFWSIFIFSSFDVSYFIPVLIVGLSFLFAAFSIYKLNSKALMASGTYMILGMIVIAISISDIGIMLKTPGLQYAVNAATWLVIVISIYILGAFFKTEQLKKAGMAGWGIVAIAWYLVAWQVEWIDWFGLRYIPFINPGALIWMAIASSGFYFSKKLKDGDENTENNTYSLTFSIASLLVVGGLFTVQIQNLWDAYNLYRVNISLTMSFMYFLFAMLIFLWGSYSKELVFKWMGSVVIIITSLKVFFFDLSGESSLYKIIALLLIGLTSILIGAINNKWDSKSNDETTKS